MPNFNRFWEDTRIRGGDLPQYIVWFQEPGRSNLAIGAMVGYGRLSWAMGDFSTTREGFSGTARVNRVVLEEITISLHVASMSPLSCSIMKLIRNAYSEGWQFIMQLEIVTDAGFATGIITNVEQKRLALHHVPQIGLALGHVSPRLYHE